MGTCLRCGRDIQAWEEEYFGGKPVCQGCFLLELAAARKKAEDEAEECSRCGRKLPYWGYKEFAGKIYCTGCFDSVYGEWKAANSCAHCGRLIAEKWQRFSGPKGELLCEKCLSEARGRFGPGAVVPRPKGSRA